MSPSRCRPAGGSRVRWSCSRPRFSRRRVQDPARLESDRQGAREPSLQGDAEAGRPGDEERGSSAPPRRARRRGRKNDPGFLRRTLPSYLAYLDRYGFPRRVFPPGWSCGEKDDVGVTADERRVLGGCQSVRFISIPDTGHMTLKCPTGSPKSSSTPSPQPLRTHPLRATRTSAERCKQRITRSGGLELLHLGSAASTSL